MTTQTFLLTSVHTCMYGRCMCITWPNWIIYLTRAPTCNHFTYLKVHTYLFWAYVRTKQESKVSIV